VRRKPIHAPEPTSPGLLVPGPPGADERSRRLLGRQMDLRSGLSAAGRDLFGGQAIEEPSRPWARSSRAGADMRRGQAARPVLEKRRCSNRYVSEWGRSRFASS
jgi:hypothetical protein